MRSQNLVNDQRGFIILLGRKSKMSKDPASGSSSSATYSAAPFFPVPFHLQKTETLAKPFIAAPPTVAPVFPSPFAAPTSTSSSAYTVPQFQQVKIALLFLLLCSRRNYYFLLDLASNSFWVSRLQCWIVHGASSYLIRNWASTPIVPEFCNEAWLIFPDEDEANCSLCY